MIADLSSEPIILASASASRRAMLAAAGVPHDVMPVDVDESSIKDALVEDGANAATIAATLARAKAHAGAAAAPTRLVLGSDSLVALGDRRFDKPANRAEAECHLRAFSGRTIDLHSAAALVRDRDVVAEITDVARLHVRPLSDAFIAGYLDIEWPMISACAGCFRIEGPGVQLFDAVDGDHFTILGMPLMKLLDNLRQLGVLAS